MSPSSNAARRNTSIAGRDRGNGAPRVRSRGAPGLKQLPEESLQLNRRHVTIASGGCVREAPPANLAERSHG